MSEELAALLERAKTITATAEEIEESDIRIAVANGMISDDRVTIDALKAVQTVDRARKSGVKEPT